MTLQHRWPLKHDTTGYRLRRLAYPPATKYWPADDGPVVPDWSRIPPAREIAVSAMKRALRHADELTEFTLRFPAVYADPLLIHGLHGHDHPLGDFCAGSPTGRYWFAAKLFTRQHGFCPWCDQIILNDLSSTDLDHIIPKSSGGPDDDWNIRLLHKRCNRQKGRKITPEAIELAALHGIVLAEPAASR